MTAKHTVLIRESKSTQKTPDLRRSAALVIPTLNAESTWKSLTNGIRLQGLSSDQVMIIDSSSTDNTLSLARAEGYRLAKIPRSSFNHGSTRQMASEMLEDFDFHVFMTQDAMLTSPSDIGNLLAAFHDPLVGAAFGRQLPRKSANPIEAHARVFNYPERSKISSFEERSSRGFKTVFMSNSFAAYRRNALQGVRGFPTVIVSEETVVAGRLLKQGWQIAYVAEAMVIHSHPYSVAQEFSRYFDIGVLHARESSLVADFGSPGGEGFRFVSSEVAYLWRNNPLLIPSSLVRTPIKYLGYQFGRKESWFPRALKRRLSGQPGYWSNR